MAFHQIADTNHVWVYIVVIASVRDINEICNCMMLACDSRFYLIRNPQKSFIVRYDIIFSVYHFGGTAL